MEGTIATLSQEKSKKQRPNQGQQDNNRPSGSSRARKRAEKRAETAKRAKTTTPPKVTFSGAQTPEWKKVDLGGAKLTNPAAAQRAMHAAGHSSAKKAREAWQKDSANQGKCFWFHSVAGKAGGGCPFTNCRFEEHGH